MSEPSARVDRIMEHALALRAELIDASSEVHPNNLAADGKTSVQSALVDLRIIIDAILERDDPDNDITGEFSTE